MSSVSTPVSNDARLKKKLGWFSLASMTFASMMGSGWLLASYYAAQTAGPASIVSWIIAGGATVLIGFIYAHLGVALPLAGGNVRWPRMTSGPFVGAIVGWAAFVQISVATPGETTAIIQYVSSSVPGLFGNGHLTPLGLAAAVAILTLFVALNYFGVVLMARLNNVLVAFKVVVPVVAVVCIIYSGFDSDNIALGGGWAPYGPGSALTATTSGGLLFAFAGVMTPAVMSGEARNPRRDVPLGLFAAVGAVLVIYVGLQIAYLVGVPGDLLSGTGWAGVNFTSPFAQIAVLLMMHWLATLLIVDSVVAPAGTLFTSTAWKARVTYGLAEDRMLPGAVAGVHRGSGIPRWALLVNLAVAIFFLLVFQSWHELVKVAGFFLAIVYAGASVAAGTIDLHPGRADTRPWLRHAYPVAGLSFVVSGLLLFWSGWRNGRDGFLIILALFVVYLLVNHVGPKRRSLAEVKDGLWFGVFITGVVLVSFLGTYGGLGVLAEPWGSLVVAVIALLCYRWGTLKARARIAAQAPVEEATAAP
ncbi:MULTISPECIES: APC family permease [Amycolatopsis]|uniref:Amino acid transporter n=2 Tax=Amycolatopsis TaxID=1813 RepID=A0A1I4BM42_9PSEU|nr:APC family permease [Amycolatopsis sacchari]SFK69257.1 Amino acid transporter [Amycolatopsis sacchari]